MIRPKAMLHFERITR